MPGRKTDIEPHAETVPARNDAGGGLNAVPKRGRRRQPKVVKRGVLATVLGPIALSVAVIIGAYGVVTLATNYWRSYQRHAEHAKAAHDDRSIIDILLKPQLGGDRVDLIIRDVDGKVRQVVASQSETDRFVNETILMLDDERDRIKQAADADIDEIFANAFADKQESIDAYADWFFEWKRSYIVLKETLTSAANRFIQAGEYESLSEAVENDVQDYFMRHYQEHVLKPEVRDQKISRGLDQVVRRAHESYRRVIANGDLRLQLFLARHTSSLKEVPADQAVTTVVLDWDAQKWKAPTYLMEDRAFDGVAGVGKAAAAGTVGALVLGPVINRAMARSFGMLSRRFATSLGTRLALAEKGAVAGTLVQPAGGTAVGAVAGVMIGIAADYFINEADEAFNRDKFVVANGEALDATLELWRGKVKANVGGAIDRWFDDARSGVVLAQN